MTQGNNNFIKDFLGSLYSDQEWSKIATNDQFEKVMKIMSDFYGMQTSLENKYENDLSYRLARKHYLQTRKPHEREDSLVGSDLKSTT